MSFFRTRLVSKYVPLPDWIILAEEGLDFFLLPLLLYMCSVGIVWILAVGLSIFMLLYEATAHKFITKYNFIFMK